MTKTAAEKIQHNAAKILGGYADKNIRITPGVEKNQYALSIEYEQAACFKLLCESRTMLEDYLIKKGYIVVVSNMAHDPANIGVRGTFNIVFAERNAK